MGTYYDNKIFSVATTLPEGHPLRMEFIGMKNKSGFFRTVLEDLYKVHPDFKRYMTMPEKERLRVYFGVQPSLEERMGELLEELEGMTADGETKRKLSLEAVYVAMFEPYKAVYAGKNGCPFALIKYFASYSAGRDVKKLQMDRTVAPDLFRSFSDSIAEFLCTYPPEKAALEEWEGKIRSLPQAEKLYMDLCADMCTVCTAGEILESRPAGYILGFMGEFFRGCADSGKSIHTAFLERMKADGLGVFREPAVTLQRKAG